MTTPVNSHVTSHTQALRKAAFTGGIRAKRVYLRLETYALSKSNANAEHISCWPSRRPHRAIGIDVIEDLPDVIEPGKLASSMP